MTETDSDNLPPPPPAAPRALTPRARRRSWAEPRVRIWWIMAIALVFITIFFTAGRVWRSWKDYSLMKTGVRVEADVIDVAGNPLRKLYEPELRYHFHMTFRLPDGTVHEINQPLKDQRKALGPGMKIPLYVDPKDPTHRWTDRVQISWLEDTMIALLLLPTVLLFLAIAIFNRIGILSAWKNGPAMHASVVEIKQSASAPLSRTLRMVLGRYHDQRIFTTLIPTRLARYQPGDVVWVIIPSTTPRWAILAELYE